MRQKLIGAGIACLAAATALVPLTAAAQEVKRGGTVVIHMISE